jgi:plastocyanin
MSVKISFRLTENYHLLPMIIAASIYIIAGAAFSSSAMAETEVNKDSIAQPLIDAKNIYENHTMILSNNVKDLVILIPNEGHHGPGEIKEARFIDQSFVPANVTIANGTTVWWFNNDVGHNHKIKITGSTEGGSNNGTVHDIPKISSNQISSKYKFNTIGDYKYSDPVPSQLGYTMSGFIAVKSSAQSLHLNSSSGDEFDTVGVMMVPAKDITKYTKELEDNGFMIDSTHSFNDIRGGQKGTGKIQALIVWTSAQKDMDEIASDLNKISLEMPYS